jgi:hypothetical protein
MSASQKAFFLLLSVKEFSIAGALKQYYLQF